MTEKGENYNRTAALPNISRLIALIEKTQGRQHGLSGMGCFYGPPGFGKTHGGIYCSNTMNVCHVAAEPVGGASNLLRMIVTELGEKPKGLTPAMLHQAQELLAISGKALIIDEADHILKTQMIEVVRSIHDSSGAPVILMGEELLPQKLTQWDRVHGRMLAWVAAEPATLSDVGHLIGIYAPEVEITPDLRETLVAASKGSLRRITNNLANIAEFAAVRGLTRVSKADWGEGSLMTGEAPAPRRGIGATLSTKGRAA